MLYNDELAMHNHGIKSFNFDAIFAMSLYNMVMNIVILTTDNLSRESGTVGLNPPKSVLQASALCGTVCVSSITDSTFTN